MKKKTLKFALCYLSAFAMLASGVVSASAGELTLEEVRDKYTPMYALKYSEGSYASAMQDISDIERWVELFGKLPSTVTEEELEQMRYTAGYSVISGEPSESNPLAANDGNKTIYVNQAGEVMIGTPQTEEEWESVDLMASYRRLNAYCYQANFDMRQRVYSCECLDGFYYAPYGEGKATIVGVDLDWLYENDPTKLVIPAEIGGLTTVRIASQAFDCITNFVPELKEIVLPDTIEEIGSMAFRKAAVCNLEQMHIPKHVRSIGYWAFLDMAPILSENCAITLPESVEYLSTGAFECHDTEVHVVLPDSPILLGGDVGTDGVSATFDWYNVTFDGYDETTEGTLYLDNDEVLMYELGKIRAGELPTCMMAIYDDTERTTHYYSAAEYQDLYGTIDRAASLQLNGTGDLDGDGKLSISDAILLSRYVAEDATVSITTEGIAQADIDGSGIIDAGDIATALKQIAGL